MSQRSTTATRPPGASAPSETLRFDPSGNGAPAAQSDALITLARALDDVSPQTLCWPVTEARDRAGCVERLRLLAPAEDHDTVCTLLRDRHFRIVTLASWCRVPGASDWYTVDDSTGTLLHVCLQRQLVLGSDTGGWRPVARERLMLPATRANSTDGRLSATSAALALCERSLRGDELHDAGVNDEVAALHRGMLTLTPDRSAGERMRERIRRLRCRLAALNRGGPRLPLLARRQPDGPALAIAVIGSDGSGKSTVSRWLADTLDAEFGARFLYFGTGDGPGSPIRRGLNALKRRSRFGSAPPHAVGRGNDETLPSAADSAPTYLRLIWATVVAWERTGKMRALERARRARFVVVTDRYPQNEQAGIHDGPRLDHLLASHTGGPAGTFARIERSIYASLARHVPDRLLLLDVPFDLARRRRPEEPEAALARRIAVARSLRYGEAPRIVLDAAEPLAAVKAGALRAALDALSADNASGVS